MLGIFDSGVGGLTVVREIKKRFPEKPILYLGDTARVPWGPKSPETVRRYCEEICEFLVSKGVKTIVIGCNTASAVAESHLKKNFPEIKFINVIDPAVEKVAEESRGKEKYKTLIIGTRGTVVSGVYEKRIKSLSPKTEVVSQACPLFVPLVEERPKNKKIADETIKEYLEKFKKDVNSIVLGCTHYPLLKKEIQDYLGKDVEIISSAQEVTARIDDLDLETGENDEYFLTDSSPHYEGLAEEILGGKGYIKKANLEQL